MSEVKQIIVVRKDLNMRKGKLARQVAHAHIKFLLANNEAERGDEIVVKLTPEESEWMVSGSMSTIVVSCDSEDELRSLMFQAELADIEVYPVIDKGKTEFHGVPTLTCAVFGPCEASDIDPITGKLPLL